MFGLLYACLPATTRGRLTSAALPGVATTQISHLDPQFRVKVDRVIESLTAQGLEPRIASTYRSAARQDALFTLGRVSQRLGGPPWTNARGGKSCHNNARGTLPASQAIDLVPPRRLRTASEKSKFYIALGAAAEKEGLRWGGRWSRKNPTWARYGLGWDPGHVQSKRCSTR